MEPRSRWAVAAVALLCFIWLAAEVARGRTAAVDAAAREAVHSISNPSLTAPMRAATALGSQAVVLGISAAAAAGLLLAGRRGRALQVVLAISGAEFWMWAIKTLFHRERPEPFFGAAALTSYSFPSGHALLSLCCYGMMAGLAGACLRGWKRRAIHITAAALILAIGISRVYLGAHHTTDVVAGYLVAVVWMAVAGRL